MTGEHSRDEQVPPGTGKAGIDESVRAFNAARKDAVGAARDSARALRRLVSADFALARSAFGRALAWSGAAIVFGASAWLLLTGAIVALLQATGMSWLLSLSLCALFNFVVAGLAAWRVAHFFDYTGMHATRRQLSKLGLFDEDDPEPELPEAGVPPAVAPTPPPPAGPPRPGAGGI